MRRNTAKALLKEGKPAVGAWMSFPSVVAAEALASIGWDWICVDTEHGAIDLETAQGLFIAIGANGTIPIVRVPWNDAISIHRILDAGAYGSVMASNYNRRLLPAEVMIENWKATVIRRRQTIDELLSLEV